MHRIPLLPLGTILILSVTAVAQRPDGAPPRRGGRGPGRQIELRELALKHFVMQHVTVEAPSLQSGKLDCVVYTPAIPEPEKDADGKPSTKAADDSPLPVVLWLHGLNDGNWRFHNEGGAATLEALRDRGEIGDMIVVAPTVARQTMYLDGESNGKVETAIAHDLLDWVTKTYPRAQKDAAHHAIMGVSMGGYGAMKIAMHHPELFGVVAVHSAAILPADPDDLPAQFEQMRDRMTRGLGVAEVLGDPIDKDKWAAQMPMAMLDAMPKEKLAALRIYFDVGTRDRYGLTAPNQAFDAALTKKEIAHTFRLVEDGGHSWGSESMSDNLEQSFRFVGAAFAAKVEKATPAASAPAATPAAGHGR
ncbi:MAG: alpha/beta hydrolase-fold protein [Planctomycetota bacterium]